MLMPENDTLHVALYKAGVVPLRVTANRISVGNPGVADILILRGDQLYVLGKAIGTTNVVVWDSEERIAQTLNVEVTHDLYTLKEKLHQILPSEEVKVHSAQGRIVLSGLVSNVLAVKAAEELARSFLPECVAAQSNILIRDASQEKPSLQIQGGGAQGNQDCNEGRVVNLLQVGGAQQVMLEVKVAEMARTVLKRFDADLNIMRFGSNLRLGAVKGGASFPDALDPNGLKVPLFGQLDGTTNPIGPPVDSFEPNTRTIADSGLFLNYLQGKVLFEAVIEASRRKGLAKILAEPTLTALTGQEAQFLAGGEFPIPVPQGGLGGVSIEFKEFGVGLKFVPAVLEPGRINLKLNVAVSELSSTSSVVLGVQNSQATFVVPSLTKRSAGTTVELADGQTIGIAGLINDTVREFVDKFPGLGDLPVLGPFFRSQEFQSGQTELVIFVTPHLARPISPQQVRLPTDSFEAPDDLEFYLHGKMEKGRLPPASGNPGTARQGSESPFGHDL